MKAKKAAGKAPEEPAPVPKVVPNPKAKVRIGSSKLVPTQPISTARDPIDATKPPVEQSRKYDQDGSRPESQEDAVTVPQQGPAYRITSNAREKIDESKVYDKVMSSEVTLSLSELFAVSVPICKRATEDIKGRKVSAHSVALLTVADKGPASCIFMGYDAPEKWLRQNPNKVLADHLISAAYTHSLRSLIPKVGIKGTLIEAIMDPGSQIVSISDGVWTHLGEGLDTSVIMPMKSANGAIDNTIGVVRDLAFNFGGIMLYMQAHVVKDAPYDILMGRPFDVLSQSQIQNFRNEETHITIHDPNVPGQVRKLPTRPRSEPRFSLIKDEEEDFQ